jgi:lipopolysaccharide export system ATP-binding protein
MNPIIPGLLAVIACVITVCVAIAEGIKVWRSPAADHGETAYDEVISSAKSSSQQRNAGLPARLQTVALCVSRGGGEALHDVSIVVDSGEVVALIGSWDSGQSTVLHAITGQIQIDSGNITLNGESLLTSDGVTRDRDTLGLTYVSNKFPDVFNLSVERNIRIVLELQPKVDVRARLERLLDLFELSAVRKIIPTDLPEWLQRRVQLARALATNPRFLLLDEPFSQHGVAEALAVHAIINYAREWGVGILIAEKDAERALSVSDRAYVMVNGRIVIEGTPNELLAMPIARRAMCG